MFAEFSYKNIGTDLIYIRNWELMKLHSRGIFEIVEGAAHHLPHVVHLEPLVLAHRTHFAQPGGIEIIRVQKV